MARHFLNYSLNVSTVFLAALLTLLLTPLFAPFSGFAFASKAIISPANASPTENDSWNNLTLAQQQILAPLKSEWNQFSSARQKKWLIIANKFQNLSPDQQQRVQNKMQEWIQLTPNQRFSARQNYIRSNKLPADQRIQRWQKYQQLSDERKAQLLNHQIRKNLITNLPTPTESRTSKLQPLKSYKAYPQLNQRSEKSPERGQILPNLRQYRHIDQKSGEIWSAQVILQPPI